MGALGDPRVPDMRHARDILLGTRFKLDLFINLRPIRCFHDRLSPLKKHGAADIDFVVFRENTEGLYVGMGGIFKQGTPDEIAVQEDVNTRKGVERIIRAAFEYAEQARSWPGDDVRQVERAALRTRSVATRLRRGCRRVRRSSSPTTCTSTR